MWHGLEGTRTAAAESGQSDGRTYTAGIFNASVWWGQAWLASFSGVQKYSRETARETVLT